MALVGCQIHDHSCHSSLSASSVAIASLKLGPYASSCTIQRLSYLIDLDLPSPSQSRHYQLTRDCFQQSRRYSFQITDHQVYPEGFVLVAGRRSCIHHKGSEEPLVGHKTEQHPLFHFSTFPPVHLPGWHQYLRYVSCGLGWFQYGQGVASDVSHLPRL